MTIKQRLGAWLIPRLPVNRRTFDIVRFELNAFVTRLLARIDPRIQHRLKKFRTAESLRVNLGSGGDNAAGWVNIDINRVSGNSLRWDIRRRLPFEDNSVLQVYASHVVEHLGFRDDVPRLFAELHRVLRPAGTLRIVVPDAPRYMEAYLSRDAVKWAALGVASFPDDMPTPMAMVNHVFHQGGEHQFGYDFDTLLYLLKGAGFNDVWRCRFQGSSHFNVNMDLSVHSPYSLYVEAVKGVGDPDVNDNCAEAP